MPSPQAGRHLVETAKDSSEYVEAVHKNISSVVKKIGFCGKSVGEMWVLTGLLFQELAELAASGLKGT
jgi:hypothetical protein